MTIQRSQQDSEELLVTSEVSRFLRVRISTVYAWTQAGKIPHLRLNGVLRFRRADLEQWLHEHTRGARASGPSGLRPVPSLNQPTPLSNGALRKAGDRVLRRFHSNDPARRGALTPSEKQSASRG